MARDVTTGSFPVSARTLDRGSSGAERAQARDRRTPWLTALGWLLLALAGQVAALQLMRAGPRIGFQRYTPFGELLAPSALPWTLILAAQAVLVTARGWPLLRGVWRWLRQHAGPARIATVVVVFALTSAVLESDPVAFAGHLVLGTVLQMLSLATLALAAASLDAGSARAMGAALDRWLGPRAEGPPGPGSVDAFALAAAAFVTAAAALVGAVAYEWHPHVPDELVYLIHARYFAEGMLALPTPPVPAAFEVDLMTYEANRWYSPVPPGWPAVLAFGVKLGIPWLVNPLLAGASVLLAHTLFRRLYDVRTARLALLLLCTSPWFIFMSMSLMTHPLTLAAALAGAVATERLVRTGRIAWALPAGFGIGVLALIRPLEGLAMAALLAAWVFLSARGPIRLAGVAVMAFAALTTAASVLPYNAHLTGSVSRFPIMAYTDSVHGPGSNALGFGANRGLGWPGLDPLPGHGAIDVIINTALNAYQVNVELLGWSVGSLLPILLLVALGRLRRADWMMFTAIAVITAAHAFYWFSGGPDFGARYWYLILPPCVVLAARGVLTLADRMESTNPRHRATNAGAAGTLPVVAALALSLCSLLAFLPWRAADKYHHYRGMRPDIRRLAREHEFGESLVLVRGRRFPDYASAAAQNPLDLSAPRPVYAWDRSPDVRRAVLLAYAGRPVWIVAGPSETGSGFRVERGPIAVDVLLSEIERLGGEVRQR